MNKDGHTQKRGQKAGEEQRIRTRTSISSSPSLSTDRCKAGNHHLITNSCHSCHPTIATPPSRHPTSSYLMQLDASMEDWMIQFFPHISALACKIDVFVPSMHILGHKGGCQYRFALPYVHGSGSTHGEDVEHLWVETNQASGSVQEMNVGHHHDTLHEIFCF